MRATTLLLSAALTLCGTASFAQSSYNIVVEPVGQTIDTIINAPIEYDDNGVVKAQHFNADSLTAEEYQALLDEADRIRAYRDANGFNYESDYITPNAVQSEYIELAPSVTTTYEYSSATTVAEADTSYQIELFAPETPAFSSVGQTTSASKSHTVAKGDTLYSISRRYDVSVPAIQAENGMSSTKLSVGQHIRIPGVIVESINTVAQPIFASAPTQDGFVTRRVVEPAPFTQAPRIETSVASEAVYAVLPKDTLYSISRRTCVGVKDIISRNGIANPNTLTPGQRITLPAGHCLSR